MNTSKPVIVVSKCLGFENCRYNGQVISDDFIKTLEPHVDYITVCPELAIGLGVPRNPIRLIYDEKKLKLYEPKSDTELTENMIAFSDKFLDSINNIDAFILKGRSPSCGIKDVKVYTGKDNSGPSTKGVGIFAGKVIEKFPYAAVEDEGRLTNYRIRDHFLIKLFTLSKFREIKASDDINELVNFQTRNKFLFMSYSQKEQKILGKLVASFDKTNFDDIISEYNKHLSLLLSAPRKYTRNINVLVHIMSFFSKQLTSREKAFLVETIEKHRQGKVTLSVPLHMLQAYAVKYENEYLLGQSIWQPYPDELVDISNSGKTEERE